MASTTPPCNTSNVKVERRGSTEQRLKSTIVGHPESTASAALASAAASAPKVETRITESADKGAQIGSVPLVPDTMLEPTSEGERPPMSVIVVSSPATSQPQQSSTPLRPARANNASSIFSTPFRLQPRNAMAVSMPGRDGATRGRKRSAHSMSVSKTGKDSLLSAKPTPRKPHLANSEQPPARLNENPSCQPMTSASSATNLKRQLAMGCTPPRDTRRGLGRVDNAMFNFQSLSLQSPKRKDSSASPPIGFLPSPPQTTGLPPASSSSSSAGTAPQWSAMVSGSASSFQSPRQSRSSFTPVYGAASPGGASIRSHSGSGSIGSNTRLNLSARVAAAQSPGHCGGCSSTKSSPKIAPLTVLHQDRGNKLPSRESNGRRPPLPGGGMSSLWLSLESSPSDSDEKDDDDDDETSLRPPRTVHCRKPSVDSISTVQNSVLSPLPRPSPMRSPGVFSSSPATASAPASVSTPHRRSNEGHPSPSHQTPMTPSTPLPRVTLTPRSTGSRRNRQNGMGLPRFPSPSDVEIDVTSPFLNSSLMRDASRTHRDPSEGRTYDPPARRNLRDTMGSFFPASSNSLALSSADGSAQEVKDGRTSTQKKAPLLDLSVKSSEMGDTKGTSDSSSCRDNVTGLSGGAFMGIQTMSLLGTARPGGILQSMVEEGRGVGAETGSMSDIDDDESEGFVLASPDVIEEEQFARCQPARQRRRRSCDRFSHQTQRMGSPSLSPTTNLAGMNYVTSNASLFGMDIAHPADAACSDARTPKARAEQEDSTSPSGAQLTKGSTAFSTGTVQGNHTFKRRKSDGSSNSVGLALEHHGGDGGGRDLVTPPAMPNPETPPPLSPKEGYFMPLALPEGNTDQRFARETSRVCIAGADRRSVTMAIARMASEAQGHSESSPVL